MQPRAKYINKKIGGEEWGEKIPTKKPNPALLGEKPHIFINQAEVNVRAHTDMFSVISATYTWEV